MAIRRLSFLLIILSAMVSCARLPTTSRSGHSTDVMVMEDVVSPKNVTVRTGDEVRLVNRRDRPVWVYFTRVRADELTCRRGFSYVWADLQGATIQPDQSASFCFGRTGVYGYSIQREPKGRGGARAGEVSIQDAIPAAIIVEDELIGKDAP